MSVKRFLYLCRRRGERLRRMADDLEDMARDGTTQEDGNRIAEPLAGMARQLHEIGNAYLTIGEGLS